MARDKDDYIFAVTENSGDVAMVLIEKSGGVLGTVSFSGSPVLL